MRSRILWFVVRCTNLGGHIDCGTFTLPGYRIIIMIIENLTDTHIPTFIIIDGHVYIESAIGTGQIILHFIVRNIN